MRGLVAFFDELVEHYPALADTLALLSDEKLRSDIDRGVAEYKRGEAVPLESILSDD